MVTDSNLTEQLIVTCVNSIYFINLHCLSTFRLVFTCLYCLLTLPFAFMLNYVIMWYVTWILYTSTRWLILPPTLLFRFRKLNMRDYECSYLWLKPFFLPYISIQIGWNLFLQKRFWLPVLSYASCVVVNLFSLFHTAAYN